MGGTVGDFYDALAGDYHRLFADWRWSVRSQADVLDALIRREIGDGPHRVLDGACGIGTQAIGLALLGHRVHATDLSPVAVARAEREAFDLGAVMTVGVADLRGLGERVEETFDVVLACDNALPHLLTDDDLRLAVAGMAAKLRAGGLFLASIRDYDRVAAVRPGGEGPRVHDGPDGRSIAFQVWDWWDDGRGYRLHQFLVRQAGDGWRTDRITTEYRALLRADLVGIAREVGLVGVRWHEPEESGYYQPIMSAYRR